MNSKSSLKINLPQHIKKSKNFINFAVLFKNRVINNIKFHLD